MSGRRGDRASARAVLAVAFGASKTLLWWVSEAKVRALAAALRSGVSWNDAWRKTLGPAWLATNSVDPAIAARAECMAADRDYFVDLDNLQESLDELDL